MVNIDSSITGMAESMVWLPATTKSETAVNGDTLVGVSYKKITNFLKATVFIFFVQDLKFFP